MKKCPLSWQLLLERDRRAGATQLGARASLRRLVERGECVREDLERAVDLLCGNDKGRLEADYVAVDTADPHEQTIFQASFAKCFRFSRSGSLGWILNELDADHQSGSANLTDHGVIFLQVAKLGHRVAPGFGGACWKTFALHEIDVGESRSAAYRVPAKGGKMVAGFVSVGNFRPRGVRTERETIGNSLCRDENIRLDSIIFNCKHFAATTKAGLHFVGDEKNSIVIQDFFHFLEVVCGRNDDSTLAHDWLGDERGHVVGSGEAHYFIDCAGALARTFFRIVRPERAVSIWRRRKGNARRIWAALFLARIISGNAERTPAAAMKAGV